MGLERRGEVAAPVILVGTYSLPQRAEPVAISLQLQGAHGVVALGAGHASSQAVDVIVRGKRVRFTVPDALAFSGTLTRAGLAGTVRHGVLHGTFALRPSDTGVLARVGLYRNGSSFLSVVQPDSTSQWLVELPGGGVHGLAAGGDVGATVGRTSGAGRARFAPTGVTWRDRRYARVTRRQREIRVGANGATLTIPAGKGPFPAVALVHGSGATTRAEFQTFAAYLESLGVVVLADDKRGVGQSLGTYPGDKATPALVDVLARDAQAEARYLARLPGVDPARVGLLGDSQAGWIISEAAAREPAVRWAVALVGPVTTVGETDEFTQLAGASQSPPSASRAAMLAQVRAAGPSGFDPRPWLEKLSIPVFWVYGDDDRNVPTELSVERLEAIRAGHDFSWVVLHSTHALIDLPTGLYSSLPQSRGFVPQLFPAIGAWLKAHGVVR